MRAISLQSSEELLCNVKKHLTELKQLLEEMNSHWQCEDMVYRFYHQSFKVYRVQEMTMRMVDALMSLKPSSGEINLRFKEILDQGASGIAFDMSHNKEWSRITRPMIEAFFHAKFFLEMAVKYGSALDKAPDIMPSGWAALLYFYNIR
nr:hypothetical protein [Candidatus Sigynarchaeum springense]